MKVDSNQWEDAERRRLIAECKRQIRLHGLDKCRYLMHFHNAVLPEDAKCSDCSDIKAGVCSGHTTPLECMRVDNPNVFFGSFDEAERFAKLIDEANEVAIYWQGTIWQPREKVR